MRVGLLARCDERGIAHQTHEFWKNMQPHRTLVICMNDPAWPENTGKYHGTNVDFVNMAPDRVCDERKARKLLRDIDVLFAVETLMDWRIADWAREMGVRTVVQGNPEFYIHPHIPHLPQPDRWVWPTTWLQSEVAKGDILPVPVPDDVPKLAADPYDGKLRVLHVAGHAAAGDRNGTLDIFEAVQTIRRDVILTVIGQDGWLPEARTIPGNVELRVNPHGVDDRWSMYENQHLIVLPRRYGGLCLPAQEAAAAGLAILMPNCPPNDTWPGPRIHARKGRLHRTPHGPVQTYNTLPMHLSLAIDQMEHFRDDLAQAMFESQEWAEQNTWSALRPLYDRLLG